MEESKTQNKTTTKSPRKARTHVPVEGYRIEQLRELTLEELLIIAKKLEVENPQELKRQDLMFNILKSQIDAGGFILFTMGIIGNYLRRIIVGVEDKPTFIIRKKI